MLLAVLLLKRTSATSAYCFPSCAYLRCTTRWVKTGEGEGGSLGLPRIARPITSLSFHQCSADNCPLGPDYYTLNGTNSCLPCSVCDRGQGVLSLCSETEDTVCRDCGGGTYSKITSLGRVCYPCTMCAQEGKSEVSPCSPTEDSTCGECASGFFLYIDSGGSECRVCSRCPQDRVVIHWIECAEAGLPLDTQCAPGIIIIRTLQQYNGI